MSLPGRKDSCPGGQHKLRFVGKVSRGRRIIWVFRCKKCPRIVKIPQLRK